MSGIGEFWFGVWGLGFGVWGLGFGVWGKGWRGNVGSSIKVFGFRIQEVWCEGLRCRGQNCGVINLVFRVQCLG